MRKQSFFLRCCPACQMAGRAFFDEKRVPLQMCLGEGSCRKAMQPNTLKKAPFPGGVIPPIGPKVPAAGRAL